MIKQAQVHPMPEVAGNGATEALRPAEEVAPPPPPASPDGSPRTTPKWGKAIGDVVSLQTTLKELEDLHTDKEMKALRKELDKEAMDLLHSSKGKQLKEQMGVKMYLETQPEEGSWEMTRWKIAHLMEHAMVRYFLICVICVNSLMIGIEADHKSDSSKDVFFIIESCFLMIFVTELALNLVGFGWLFFDEYWHHIDACVVLVSLVDYIVTLASDDDGNGLSVLRLVRVLRVLRIISHSEKLASLVSAFAKGMESLMWVLLLLVLFLYIFAVLGKSFFAESGTLKQKLVAEGLDVDELWGTIPGTMMTLTSLATYDNAMIIQRAVGEVYPHAWIYFAIFMAVVSIGVMELMNGIFIEALMDEKKKFDNERKFLEEVHRNEVGELMVNLFRTYDVDDNGQLDGSELECCLSLFEDPSSAALMESVGINAVKMQQALHVADIDCSGTISEQEFRMAVNSLYEPPMRLHLGIIQRKLASVQLELKSDMNKRQEKTMTVLQSIDARLGAIEQALKASGSPVPVRRPDKLPPLS